MDCNNDGDDEWDDIIGGGDDNDEGSEDEPEQDSCTYHLCSDSGTNYYLLGWQNFSQAWSIWSNPNATYWQRFGAGAYMGTWGGMHLALLAGATILTLEALVPGSITCMMALECAKAVFWSGSDAAKAKAAEFAGSINGVTLEQTVPGRILNSITNNKTYPYLKSTWEFLSKRFASGASGPANIFIHYPTLNPTGILVDIELNALGLNLAVLQINIYSVP